MLARKRDDFGWKVLINSWKMRTLSLVRGRHVFVFVKYFCNLVEHYNFILDSFKSKKKIYMRFFIKACFVTREVMDLY